MHRIFFLCLFFVALISCQKKYDKPTLTMSLDNFREICPSSAYDVKTEQTASGTRMTFTYKLANPSDVSECNGIFIFENNKLTAITK